MEPTLNAVRPATPEDYHSAREPSEFEYESEGSEGQVQILQDTPPWLLPLPITIWMVLNVVTPRIMTGDARSRSVERDGSTGR